MFCKLFCLRYFPTSIPFWGEIRCNWMRCGETATRVRLRTADNVRLPLLTLGCNGIRYGVGVFDAESHSPLRLTKSFRQRSQGRYRFVQTVVIMQNTSGHLFATKNGVGALKSHVPWVNSQYTFHYFQIVFLTGKRTNELFNRNLTSANIPSDNPIGTTGFGKSNSTLCH